MSPVIYVVSGLPRSGTSMMMGMLAAGGLPVLADGRRASDVDNPRGYFELEAVKGSEKDTAWVADAGGKVVKVISYLLTSLPADRDYRVVFMRRSLDQVVSSQRAMLERLAAPARDGDDAAAREMLAEHLVDLETWFESAPHVQRIGVNYERVLADPRREAARIAAFLGAPLDIDAMCRHVEPALQRQK